VGTWLDVSMPLVSGMPRAFVYPEPVFEPTILGQQLNGEPITATRIEMYAHVGTHIETARHVFGRGATLDDYSVDRFVGPGAVIDLSSTKSMCVDVADLERASPSVLDDAFVLLCLADRPATDEAAEHRYLSEDAARWLVDAGVRAVGVDTTTPDMHIHRRAHRFDLPVHRILLDAGLLIIENLGESLRQAAGRRAEVHALPLRIPGSESSPVRVVLSFDD
jgi:arylformamidase